MTMAKNKTRAITMSPEMATAARSGTKTQTRRVVKPQPLPFVQGTPDRHAQKHDAPYLDAYCSERKTPENPRGMSDVWCWWTRDDRQGAEIGRCPYGHPGDRLWVREEHWAWGRWTPNGRTKSGRPRFRFVEATINPRDRVFIKPDGPFAKRDGGVGWVYRHARFMPRDASRTTLELVDVRIERLQDISEDDARAEGLTSISKDGGVTWKWGLADRDGLPGTDDYGMPWKDWSVDARRSIAKLWDRINGERQGCSWSDNPWVWVLTFRRARRG